MDFIDLKTQQAAIKAQLDQRIAAVLAHGQYILGPEVRELEQALAAYTGSQHCLTVASGTEALLIALMALGIGPGDEVITTPFTFVATAEVIALVGAKPVFVDVEGDTANMDVRLLEQAISPRTKAIMPVSLYGQVCDMDEINALAAKHGLPVIEDAAQSFGAMYKGRRSGNLSTIGCTSFFPSKPFGCYGDGGAIFTNDAVLAKAMSEIRVHGQEKRYWHTHIGVGGRLDTLQAAIMLAKWPRFDWEVLQRAKLGARYNQLITAQSDIAVIAQRSDRSSVFAQYTVLLPNRDAVAAKLNAAGIPTAVHYPTTLNHQPAYQHYVDAAQRFPVAESLAAQVLSLPMSADLSEAQQDEVVTALLAAVK